MVRRSSGPLCRGCGLSSGSALSGDCPCLQRSSDQWADCWHRGGLDRLLDQWLTPALVGRLSLTAIVFAQIEKLGSYEAFLEQSFWRASFNW